LVLAIASPHRPPPARLRRLVTRTRRPWGPATSRLRFGRSWAAAAAGLLTVPVAPWPPLLPLFAATLAWWWPARTARRRARRRTEEISAAVPEAVDLFVLAVDAGLTVPLALDAVARRLDGPLGDELRRTTAEVRELGRRTADALDDLAAPTRAGDGVRPLAAALAASERYGAPLAQTLVRLADESRRARRQRAEEAARRLPVTLLFPLVTCTLPAFGLLTVGPLVAGALGSLRL
jgi:tight adherence protein C